MKQFALIALAWWFWAYSNYHAGVRTVGPFTSIEDCEHQRSAVAPVSEKIADKCWRGAVNE